MREYDGAPTRKKGEIKQFNTKKIRLTNIDFNTSNPVLTRIVIFLLAAAILVYGVYQFLVLEKNKSPLKTMTALERTISKSVTARGVIVREESVLRSVASGTVVPAIPNGSKVSKGDTVANVFASASDASDVLRLREIEDEISYYENIESLSFGSMYTDKETYRQNIAKSIYSAEKRIEQNELSELGASLQELSIWTTRRQISTGSVVDVSEKLAALQAQRERLSYGQGASDPVKAEEAGYYVNKVDGFEGKTDFDGVLSMQTSDVEALLNQSVHTENAHVGKLITKFVWYYVCIVPEKETDSLKIKDTVTLSFPSLSEPEVKMILNAKNSDYSGNTVLVFSSTLMNAEIAALRLEEAGILLESYTGYQVDVSAIRTVNEVQGVYVQVGNIVQFRKIKMIYVDDNIRLIGAEEGEPGYIRLYDEIILEGIDLYDGKIIS